MEPNGDVLTGTVCPSVALAPSTVQLRRSILNGFGKPPEFSTALSCLTQPWNRPCFSLFCASKRGLGRKRWLMFGNRIWTVLVPAPMPDSLKYYTCNGFPSLTIVSCPHVHQLEIQRPPMESCFGTLRNIWKPTHPPFFPNIATILDEAN